MNKKYSLEDENFIQENLFILSNEELAKKLGYTKNSVIQKKKELKLNKNRINPFLSSFRSFLFKSLDLLEVGKRLVFQEDLTSTIQLYLTEYNKEKNKAISFNYDNKIVVLKIDSNLNVIQIKKTKEFTIKHSLYEVFKSIKYDEVFEIIGIGKRTVNLYSTFFNKESNLKKISYRDINSRIILFRVK